MNKIQFVGQLNQKLKEAGLNSDRKKTAKFVEAMLSSIGDGLKKDKKVLLSGFGVLEVHRLPSKMITSPLAGGKKYFMPPTDSIRFRTSKHYWGRAAVEEINETDNLENKPEVVVKEEQIVSEIPDDLSKTSDDPEVEEVLINLRSRKKSVHFDNENSPISRLAKRILFQFDALGADLIVIKAEKTNGEVRLFDGENLAKTISVPKDSISVLIEKFKKVTTISAKRKTVGSFIHNGKLFVVKFGLDKFGKTLRIGLVR